MSVYVLAQLRMTDEPSYRRYQARFAEVFAGSGGRLLCADESPRVLEGDWFGDKLVLMAFDSEAQAMRFLRDPAYQAISVDRRAGAQTVALLARGLAR